MSLWLAYKFEGSCHIAGNEITLTSDGTIHVALLLLRCMTRSVQAWRMALPCLCIREIYLPSS